jgi:hypothetical protein
MRWAVVSMEKRSSPGEHRCQPAPSGGYVAGLRPRIRARTRVAAAAAVEGEERERGLDLV